MSFNSLDFCIRFLPVFLIAYFLIPVRFRRIGLVLAGLVYYGSFGIKYIPAVLTILVINYIPFRFWVKKKAFIGYVMAGLDLAFLILSKITGWQVPGISFLVFEMVSLQVDAVRGKTETDDPLTFFAYGLFFPKMINGPISRYSRVRTSLKDPKKSLEDVETGLVDFILGLGYKVLIADSIGGIYRGVKQTGTDSISFGLALLCLYSISLQIYFDFHGYSLMAKGIARMAGIGLEDNFAFPYSERSISGFYRKWHMTLTGWFKDYLYIPLGGNRKGLLRCLLNILIVWLATALWHGFTWNYLIWGLSLGFFICMEKLFLKKLLEKAGFLSHIYVWLVIPFTWVFFMTETPMEAFYFFRQLFMPLLNLFGIYGEEVVYSGDFILHLSGTYPALIAAVVFLIPPVEKAVRRETGKWWRIALMTGIFLGSLYMMKLNQSNPFLYYLF